MASPCEVKASLEDLRVQGWPSRACPLLRGALVMEMDREERTGDEGAVSTIKAFLSNFHVGWLTGLHSESKNA